MGLGEKNRLVGEEKHRKDQLTKKYKGKRGDRWRKKEKIWGEEDSPD